jgi:hypothetical protein
MIRLVLVVAVALGCGKDKLDEKLPAELRPKPATVDATSIKAPPLFAHVPADSPYVLGAFEPVSLEYYAKLKAAIAPVARRVMARLRDQAADRDFDRLLDALVSELDGKWSARGLESLGLSATPRFAFYGLGVWPMVARIEVKDHDVLRATFERVAAKAGIALPPLETHGGRSFWRIARTDVQILVSLADRHLVIAVGRPAELDARLALILGSEKPAQSMASGRPLIEVMTRHGFGPELIGFVDTRRIVGAVIERAGKQPSAACTSQLDRLAGRVPRFVIGYTEITAKRASGGAVLELAPDLVREIAAMKTEVPGLAAAMATRPMFAVGGGLDFVAAQDLVRAAAGAARSVATTCELADLARDADELGRQLGKPLPDVIRQVTGGVLAVQSMEFRKSSPMPSRVEAFTMASVRSGRTAFAAAKAELPLIEQLGMKPDGELRPIGDLLPIPFDLFGGISERAMVFSVGDAGRKLARRVLEAKSTGGDKAPLVVASYDYGKLLALRAQLGDLFEAEEDAGAELDAGLANMFGRAAASIDVGDKGLVFWGTVELK